MIDLNKLTILEARKKLDSKEFTAVELSQTYLDEIKNKNEKLNAYLEVYDDVIEQAQKADALIAEGKTFPLLGIPLAIKDNIVIKGKKATSGSKILESFVSPYDSTVIKKLRAQGAVFLGRTNMDEFALGSSTENSAYGVTRNPFDDNRVSGGTSGGSACAVSANLALAALGSDTGGSIRQPSSFCGVIGLKPTYGKVSRYGLMAATSSFDVIGTVTKTIQDSEILFGVINGNDSMDSTTITETTYPKKEDKKKIKIGVPWDLVNQDGINMDVKKNFEDSVKKLEELGFDVVDVKIPNCLAIYYIINFAEVSSNLSRFDGVKYGFHLDGKDLLGDYMLSRGQGFGKEARRRILLGTYVLSSGYYDAYYGKAQSARESLKKQFNALFKEVDLILTPTSPVFAWKIGEKSDPLSMYLEDVFTVTANIIGVPAVSVPSGSVSVDGSDLPLGIQFMAPHDCEELLFEAGKKFLNE